MHDPTVKTVSMLSPYFLDNEEIIHQVEKCQTGHSGGIRLSMEGAPDREGITVQRGLGNMKELTTRSHHYNNLSTRITGRLE